MSIPSERCTNLKGFGVEGQQLGAAQAETECYHLGRATKLHSFKTHNTQDKDR